ncbi:unannotated protein [freshwater metagenome]|uniref:Unannotated protein n=1 Tax=freshwater metagenome TaxID=449393 RepID=A0A6J7KWS2_9ZZZZ
MKSEVDATGLTHPIDLRHPDLAATLDVPEREVVGRVPFSANALWILAVASHIAAGREPTVGSGKADSVEL